MIKHLTKVISSFALISMMMLLMTITVNANSKFTEQCGYNGEGNPDLQTMNCLLTETALEFDVPPEIVKAIAEGESGDWRHFDENGDPIISSDNGIGIMQITNQSNYDEARLKSDVVYNIRAGVELLDRMFQRSDLPIINGKKRDVIEHWYFAIMAYNGTKPVNSPIVQATGERNHDAYQEKVISIIEDLGLVEITELPFQNDDFQYDPNSNNNIEFVTMSYNFMLPFTKTKHQFEQHHQVRTITALHLRSRPTTDSNSKGILSEGESLTITGPFVYEENRNKKNHFVWYPVKRSNGTTGYVASSYLKLNFTDVPKEHYAEDAIYYLFDRGIINGIGNGEFGLKQDLKRWQAVLMINRANNVSLQKRPNPGFEDVPKDYLYYEDIAAAVDEGLFKGMSETEFNPDASLTRREMAVVLQRLYKFPEATNEHPFTDINADWYADEVARLYDAGITNGMTETTFGPKVNITREQLSMFMARAENKEFRLK